MDQLVAYEVTDGIATVTMDDGKVNALSMGMISALHVALDRARADEAVVVITGRSGVFSGGFDLKVLGAGGEGAAQLLNEGFELSLRLLEHPAPVVIACSGHAIAMGSFLLLSADYRIGVDGPYRVVANEVAIGMTMPWAAIALCRQRLSPASLDRALNLAVPFTPTEAAAAGFLDRVVEDGELQAAATAVAAGFKDLGRAAHTATKQRTRRQAVAAIREGLAADQPDFRYLTPGGKAAKQ
jgi:enoyl-CoA hydratase